MKPSGAMISTRPEATSSSVTTPAHAAEMVAVGVGIDDRRHRQPFAHMLLEEFPRRARGLGGGHDVDQDPAGLAAHEGHVRQIEAANLIDAGDDLVETEIVVEPGDPGRRGVDAVEVPGPVQEVVIRDVEGDVAGIGHDARVGPAGDEPAFLLAEVARVGEGKLGLRLLEHADGMGRWRLALGVEVPGERRPRGLRLCGTLADERATECESRAGGGKGGQHLATVRHGRSPCGLELA